MGEFSKNLKQQGIKCASLDIKSLVTNPDANQVRGDAYKMPFADESFSIVHGRGVFDDVLYGHNFPELLAEIARVLKPKGILSILDFVPPPPPELRKRFKFLTESDKEYAALWEKI